MYMSNSENEMLQISHDHNITISKRSHAYLGYDFFSSLEIKYHLIRSFLTHASITFLNWCKTFF